MAFAALISLKHTIEGCLKNSGHVSAITQSLQSAHNQIKPLQQLVESLETLGRSNKRAEDAVAHIQEAAYRLEDVLETHDSESPGDEDRLGIHTEEVKQETLSFIRNMSLIRQEWSIAVEEDDKDDDEQVTESTTYVRGMSLEMVGLEDEFNWLRRTLKFGTEQNVISLVGMGGVGKTALAVKLIEDEDISEQFDCCVLVTVGQKCPTSKQILLSILSQLRRRNMDALHQKSVHSLGRFLFWELSGKRYLIVLDDIWSTKAWMELKNFLPENNNQSRVLVTTRLQEVAESLNSECFHRVRFLNARESWDLLCREVFPEDRRCPIELEKAGKEISKNCEGLPLAIITVAKFLSKQKKTPECWKMTANRKNSVFADAEEEMSKVLLSSYKHLSSYLKPCFLYMAIFPPKYKIHASKLIKLWSVENLIECIQDMTFEDSVVHCLQILVSQSLIILDCESSSGKAKTFILHFTFRYISTREAKRNHFLHIVTSPEKNAAEGIEKQRRLCVHYNGLLGIKEVHALMKSAQMARSLLCTGPYHKYQVPVYFDLRLLRVLDALSIRFYEFPNEVLKLIRLRYLALTCIRNVHASISKLESLECLIIGRHLRINSNGPSVFLPMEIWNLKELKHLDLFGADLPECISIALATSLSTLRGITPYSCTEGVLGRFFNLEKLGIQIELWPDSTKAMHCFDHLSHLHQLHTLKCVVVNPNLGIEAVPRPTCSSLFPSGLKKLTLSGFGYPWEVMDIIGMLPSLEVLKLQCYAFQGPVWKTSSGLFLKLRYLHIEDTDLKNWEIDVDYDQPFDMRTFRSIKDLVLKHCYKLEKIPYYRISPDKIELVACNPFFENSIKRFWVFRPFTNKIIRTWEQEEAEAMKGVETMA